MKNAKYVIISPVRNEEEYIENTLRSMVRQTLPPAEWIIVDDGSTDRTVDIVKEYQAKCPWIRLVTRDDRGYRKRGRGVVNAFYLGMHHILHKDWEYIVKLDGDVSFDSHYFHMLLMKFVENPDLGIASGVLDTKNTKVFSMAWRDATAFYPVGPVKTYKRQCFDAIGGLKKMLDWDTYDVIKAQMLGWETASYEQLPIIHYRDMGATEKGLDKEINWGEAKYFLGYHPLYMLASGIIRSLEKPYIIGSIAMLYGYCKSWMQGIDRIDDADFIRFLRNKQMRLLLRSR